LVRGGLFDRRVVVGVGTVRSDRVVIDWMALVMVVVCVLLGLLIRMALPSFRSMVTGTTRRG
jgi:uncharacterized membrane protein